MRPIRVGTLLAIAIFLSLGSKPAIADTFTFSGPSSSGGFTLDPITGSTAVSAPIDTGSDADTSTSLSLTATLAILAIGANGTLSITDSGLGLLAAGTFSDGTFSFGGGNGSFAGNLDSAALTPAFLTALGLSPTPPSFVSGSFDIALINLTNLADGSLKADVASSGVDVDTTATVPEPATLTLLSTGLLACAAAIRRKRRS